MCISMAQIGCMLAVLFVINSCSPSPMHNGREDTAPYNEPAPLMVSKWVTGNPISLREGRGKNTFLVEFWRTSCPACVQLIPHLSEIQNKYKKDGLIVIAVSNEDSETVVPFIKKVENSISYRIILDDQNRTMNMYLRKNEVYTLPYCFLIDKHADVIWHGDPADDLETKIQIVLQDRN